MGIEWGVIAEFKVVSVSEVDVDVTGWLADIIVWLVDITVWMVGVTVWLSVLVGKGAGRVGGADVSLRLRGGVEGVVEEWTTVAVRGSLLQHVARLHIVVHLWARFRHCQPKACSPIHYG